MRQQYHEELADIKKEFQRISGQRQQQRAETRQQEPAQYRPEGLRLEVDVRKAEVLPRVGRGRLSPGGRHGLELLVEQLAAPVKRHAQCLVLLLVPAHSGLHDEAALAQEVERRQLLREQQRMAQRVDHRGQGDAQPRRRRGDGRGEHERIRPGRRGILVPGSRVVARVAHDPAGARGGAEHHVLAEHDGVHPRRLGLHGDAHEGAQVAR